LEPFRLVEEAILDIDAIWLYLLEREGLETADRIVTEIFKGFYRLAEMPAIGHRRADLTSRSVLFYRILSYLIVYQPGQPALTDPRGAARKTQRGAALKATAISKMWSHGKI
jgi:plasmid stabilization system protein ParE